MFELGAVNEIVNQFSASVQLPEIEYTIAPIPKFGKPCNNAEVKYLSN